MSRGMSLLYRGCHLETLMKCFGPHTEIATLVKKAKSMEEVFDPNRPKVVLDNKQNALYFSRSPIPFIRGAGQKEWLSNDDFLASHWHLCLQS